MALSTYFNLDSQVSTFFHEGTPPPTLPPALAALAPEQHHYDQSFFLLNPNNNTTFDYSSYFDHTASFLYPEIYPHFPNCPSAYYDPNNIFPTDQDFLSTPCSKRQKCLYDDQSSLMNLAHANFFDGVVQNPCCYSMQSEELPLLPEAELYSAPAMPELAKLYSALAMPEFSASPQQLFSQGGCAFGASSSSNDDEHHHHRHHEEKRSNERSAISAQSLAARERRRKITEKTQELGKLVPGGSKMNTAEMLHAAGKYVQFLQAQVEMLQLMNTLQVILIIISVLSCPCCLYA